MPTTNRPPAYPWLVAAPAPGDPAPAPGRVLPPSDPPPPPRAPSPVRAALEGLLREVRGEGWTDVSFRRILHALLARLPRGTTYSHVSISRWVVLAGWEPYTGPAGERRYRWPGLGD